MPATIKPEIIVNERWEQTRRKVRAYECPPESHDDNDGMMHSPMHPITDFSRKSRDYSKGRAVE